MANLVTVDAVRKDLGRMEPEFKKVLPPNVSVERFTRVAMTAIQREPKLLNCNPGSLYRELLQCAKDGLIPDGREAAITPFGKNGDAQYMPMIGGIYKKIRNSGEVEMLTSHVVYENDQFEFGSNSTLGDYVDFKPNLRGDRGQMIGAYAMAKTVDDGAPYIEFMSANQINAVREASKAKNGPWDGPFWDEMVRKTVVRRLSKRLPMDTDAHDVLERNDEKVVGDETNTTTNTTKKTTSVAEMIDVAPIEVEETEDAPPAPAKSTKSAAKPEKNAEKPQESAAKFTRPAQTAPVAPEPTKASRGPDHLMSRPELMQKLQAAFTALSMSPEQAKKWIENESEGTALARLTDVEVQVMYFDHLIPFALERGVTIT